jgi:hypothetical protein
MVFVLLQHREDAWFASSVKSRSQYLGPQPGVPVLNDDEIMDVHLDPSAGPVDAFCLLVLDPEKVMHTFFVAFCRFVDVSYMFSAITHLMNFWSSAVFFYCFHAVNNASTCSSINI